MTAQASDWVRWGGADWSLVGIDGTGLFDPEAHAIRPVATSTANWRGFVCHYAVEGDRLVLDGLDIGLSGEDAEAAEEGRGPMIGGHAPAGPAELGGWAYAGLGLPVAFDGRLLLGDGFIQDLYVHMGFHPAWKYERVTELELAGGRLVRAEDLSARYAKMRDSASKQPLRPSPGSPLDRVKAWIASTFDRSYASRRPDPRDAPVKPPPPAKPPRRN